MPPINPIPLRVGAATVMVKMFPTPRTIGESRQVLAALQKFGEVATFKNLNYAMTKKAEKKLRPAVVVFDSSDAAQKAIASSPIAVTLTQPPIITPTPELLHTKASSSTPGANLSSNESVTPAEAVPETITCVLSTGERWPHFAEIRRNPYYLAYKEKIVHPRISQDMKDPKSQPPLKELRDVLQSNVESLAASAAKEQNKHPEGASPLTKYLKDIRVENRNWGAESLMGLYEGRTGRALYEPRGKQTKPEA